MYSRQSKYINAERGRTCSSPTAGTDKETAYEGAHEQLFGPDEDLKAAVVAHPLFEQLLAAHVACLRVGTPLEEQHLIDAAVAKRHLVAAKYLALLTLYHPAENHELNRFMVNYTLLLQSFKEQLLEHLYKEGSKAIYSCKEMEKMLFNLTGVSSFNNRESSTMIVQGDGKDDEILSINDFLPKKLQDHVQKELKQELKKDYPTKLKEVHDEILRKRNASRLQEDTTHILKDWWTSHAKWPYPTEEEKVQLMVETGLNLKQINNWFINQRKRNWQIQREKSKG